jgi:hypothetical protein
MLRKRNFSFFTHSTLQDHSCNRKRRRRRRIGGKKTGDIYFFSHYILFVFSEHASLQKNLCHVRKKGTANVRMLDEALVMHRHLSD